MQHKHVSVITVTQKRDAELLAAIESVAAQDYPGHVEHIIIGDDSKPLHSRENQIIDRHPHVNIVHVDMNKYRGHFDECYAPSRVGFMRNIGISLARGDYICQLDDDNLYDKNHVSSLVDTIESDPRIGVAYSWRRLVYSDGKPYDIDEYPWTPQARLAFSRDALSRYIFEELVKSGIRERGSNVVKDMLLAPDGQPVYTVDTSELMVRKEVHTIFPFTVHFFWRDMVGDWSDDYAFVKKCHEGDVQFKCSEKVTLSYTIGGVSNSPGGR